MAYLHLVSLIVDTKIDFLGPDLLVWKFSSNGQLFSKDMIGILQFYMEVVAR